MAYFLVRSHQSIQVHKHLTSAVQAPSHSAARAHVPIGLEAKKPPENMHNFFVIQTQVHAIDEEREKFERARLRSLWLSSVDISEMFCTFYGVSTSVFVSVALAF